MARAKETKKSLENFLKRSVFDELSQAICVIDEDLKILDGNNAFKKLFNLEHDFRGENFFDLISFRKEAEFKKKFIEFLNSEKQGTLLETEFYRPSGLVANLRLVPLKNKAKFKKNLLMVVFDDITEKIKQIEEMANKNEETKKLILIAFHDIKASIVAIQGLLESFIHENEPFLSERAKFYLENIKNRLFFTERLARDVVDFTRIGMYFFPTERVNLNEILMALEQELSLKLKEKGLKIKVMNELPIIYASRERFFRVFFNLLDNAIKYSKSETKIPEILVGFYRKEKKLVFFVKDNGIGISKENQATIFDLFERLPRAIQEHPEGTGIGLAIVKKIIEMYQGEVWVESEENEGATFYFSLPEEIMC